MEIACVSANIHGKVTALTHALCAWVMKMMAQAMLLACSTVRGGHALCGNCCWCTDDKALSSTLAILLKRKTWLMIFISKSGSRILQLNTNYMSMIEWDDSHFRHNGCFTISRPEYCKTYCESATAVRLTFARAYCVNVASLLTRCQPAQFRTQDEFSTDTQ